MIRITAFGVYIGFPYFGNLPHVSSALSEQELLRFPRKHHGIEAGGKEYAPRRTGGFRTLNTQADLSYSLSS